MAVGDAFREFSLHVLGLCDLAAYCFREILMTCLDLYFWALQCLTWTPDGEFKIKSRVRACACACKLLVTLYSYSSH